MPPNTAAAGASSSLAEESSLTSWKIATDNSSLQAADDATNNEQYSTDDDATAAWVTPISVARRYNPRAGAPSSRSHWSIADFVVGEKLGDGMYGSVFVAQEKRSLYKIALKIVDKELLLSQQNGAQVCHSIKREIEIQSHLRHRNVLRLFGFFHDEQRVYIMLELASNGDLFDALEQRGGRFSEPEAATYVCELADALHYCHSLNVMHRDIKPENIMLGPRGELKLADFGCAVHSAQGRQRQTFRGTKDYVAPEMVAGQHSLAVDVWALGVLTYEMLCGIACPDDDDECTTFERIRQRDFKFPTDLSTDARKLITQLLAVDPAERMTLRDVPNHVWCLTNRMQRRLVTLCRPSNDVSSLHGASGASGKPLLADPGAAAVNARPSMDGADLSSRVTISKGPSKK